ncbi:MULTISPECIES: hypothetical protein [Pseudomonas]|uniref:hypothetical protein n=1 Tax=Pseudomonas TaxID=286 RepID=UPI000FC43721|nr:MULTISPECIES: hypothetical protein [Pseudomonas]RUE17083.1 hypothetical protein IPC1222_25565 [Pseudomonas aeruginosa]CAH0134035.1 hypothetical protein SRABI111_00290 [Pseudomonas carnis]CAH0136995.1 hypothetical protein SRABI110_00434 [Pseudomonas carnis]CAH0160171.1 hypothetical protein SRABI64_00758 [Pseudomonas carnis]CAH0199952.1 hypothetical protein SRABI08_01868 [Pseudomonas carnis]
MKLTKLVIAIATFATITLSSSAYIATQDVTSAVLVDKAKHSLDLTTNGLHNISVSEAFTIDKSEAAQINFLRCSFARPEFRFSWFCHQMKKDGKMTKNSYVALKDDQQKYFKENVIKSVSYEAQKWILRAEQLRVMKSITRSEPFNSGGITASKRSEYIAEYFESQSRATGVNSEAQAKMNNFSISDVIERFDSTNSPSSIKDSDPLAKINDGLIDSHLLAMIFILGISIVMMFLLCILIVMAVAVYNGEGDLKQKVKVLRKRRYKLLRTAKPFSKEAAEISELDIKIEELDNKLAKLKDEVKGENHE